MRRLADRAVDEAADALRPFGYYDPHDPQPHEPRRADVDRRLKIEPGEPVLMREVDVEIIGAGRATRPGDRPDRDREPAAGPGRGWTTPAYEKLKKRPDAHSARARLSGRHADPARTAGEPDRSTSADVHLQLDTGGRYEFGAVTIEQDVDRRRSCWRASSRFTAGPAVLARDAAQHAVRTRGQQLFFERVGHARRARPGER